MVCKTPKILYARDVQRRRYWMPLPPRPSGEDHFEREAWDRRNVKRVPCGACLNCALDRISELTGMCLAEAATSDDVLFLTLTYSPEGLRGRDKLRDRTRRNAEGLPDDLYADFQRMLKRLRKKLDCDGLERSVRYLVAGEYGGQKGRPHWHVMLFFKGCRLDETTLDESMEGRRDEWAFCLPDIYSRYGARTREERRARDNAAMISWAGWAHGRVFFERPLSPAAYRYALKYTLKGKRAEAMAEREAGKVGGLRLDPKGRPPFYRWSLKPTLGGEFFERLAVDRCHQRLPPNDFRYWPCDGYQRDGKRQYFVVRHSARRRFVRQYCETYRELQLAGEVPIGPAFIKTLAPQVKKCLRLTVSEAVAEDAKRRGPARFDAEEWRELFAARDEARFREWEADRRSRFDQGRPVFKEHGLGWIGREFGLFEGVPCVVGIWADGRRSIWSGVDGLCVQWFRPDQRELFERCFKPVTDRAGREKIEAEVKAFAERCRPAVTPLSEIGAEEFRSWAE